ncbi:MAG: lysine biosynthesis protein LysX [Thermoproteota archaeon]|nr:MAG: lysine biosynthesis protein LysX [Candidatus Korarchaeota archaeon]RLG54937.1 MAG: lysine biosynthesis protein LysX [Candidatus Korarchaeota archaeon]
MRVAVVYDRLRAEEKAIMRAVEELGHKPVRLHLNSTHLSLGMAVGFSIALERATSGIKAYSSAAALEASGVKVVNSSQVIANCYNKLVTTAKLLESGVPAPRTAIAFSLEGAYKAAEEVGYPVVVKPVNGSWGRLVSLAQDEEELRTILEHREAIPSPFYRIHYIQEFIRKPGRDIRAFATEDRLVTAVYRVAAHWITNTARGARAEKAELTSELEEIAVKAARAVGGGFLGVDIAEDSERGLLVLEVNSVTEFRNAARVTGVDIAKEIVEYAIGA